MDECETIGVVEGWQGLGSQSNGPFPLWCLHRLAVPEDVCEFRLQSAGEPALLIVLRNVDVGKHGRQGRHRNLIASLLVLMMACLLTHRMPPFPISLLFD